MQVEIVHKDGSLLMNGNKFRMIIGAMKLKSMKYTVHDRRDSAVFRGGGWGHGVGLCQEGAEGMAAMGYDYIRILDRYYHDLELTLVE